MKKKEKNEKEQRFFLLRHLHSCARAQTTQKREREKEDVDVCES